MVTESAVASVEDVPVLMDRGRSLPTITRGDLEIRDGGFTVEPIAVRDVPGFDAHELVVACHDKSSGLHAFIAIHDTRRGPSLGGCRMWSYADERAALTDVLRLSQGMSYKHAVAELPHGGGKAVIVGNPHRDKTPALFAAFGRFVEALRGHYITAEDVGVGVEDMTHVRTATTHVAGLPIEDGGSGDPSPMTAFGVYCGLRAAVAHRFGSDDLNGRTVAVQGVGHVGYVLCRHLHEAGARLVVTDINAESLEAVRRDFGATVVTPEVIYEVDADVFAPCALGGTVNALSIPRLRAQVVAGAANNQLAEPEDARRLAAADILYAPDYVINAGGVINIAHEHPVYDPEAARQHTARIGATLTAIFEEAQRQGRTTAEVADDHARRNLEQAL